MERKTQQTCGFCRGKGKDPFELLSALSTCQVCAGSGIVEVKEPSRKCVFCGGSGVYPNSRLTCTVCGGKGFATIPEEYVICPQCRGTGTEFESKLPCISCHGLGVVSFKPVRQLPDESGRKGNPPRN